MGDQYGLDPAIDRYMERCRRALHDAIAKHGASPAAVPKLRAAYQSAWSDAMAEAKPHHRGVWTRLRNRRALQRIYGSGE